MTDQLKPMQEKPHEFDATLKRMLSTPPKPKQQDKEKPAKLTNLYLAASAAPQDF